MIVRAFVPFALFISIPGCAARVAESAASSPASVSTSTADAAAEAEIRAVVDRLFTGMRTADTAMMTSVIDMDARMVSAAMRNGEPIVRVGNVRAWLAGVAGSREPWIERVWDVEVRVDGTLATAWMQYDFHIGDRFSHCGVNAMQLARGPAGWKIVNLADNRRTECTPPPA